MDLDRATREQLQVALLSALHTWGDIRHFTTHGLGRNFDQIAGGDNLTEAVTNLIQWAEGQGKVRELVTAALDRAPENKLIRELAPLLSNSRKIPFVVAAMNHEEALQLKSLEVFKYPGVPRTERARWGEFLRALRRDGISMTAFEEHYTANRDRWIPYQYEQRAVCDVVTDAIHEMNRLRSGRVTEPHLEVELWSEAFFDDDTTLRNRTWERLSELGFVLVIDAVSLFHPGLRRTLEASHMGSREQVAVIVLSPVSQHTFKTNQVIEQRIGPEVQRTFARFAEQFDWRCEFGVGDVRGLRRWLYAILPEAERITLGQKPNPARLRLMSRNMGDAAGLDQAIFGQQSRP